MEHACAIVIRSQSHRTVDVLFRREVNLRLLVEEDEIRDRSLALFQHHFQAEVRFNRYPHPVLALPYVLYRHLY